MDSFLLIKSILSKHNLHKVYCTHFDKCITYYVITTIEIQNILWPPPKVFLGPLCSNYPSTSISRHPQICFISLLISFACSRLQYKWNYTVYTLCVWLLSHCIMFLRFICVATCINSLFLFLLLSNILSYEYTTFFFNLFICCWTFGVFPPFDYCE